MVFEREIKLSSAAETYLLGMEIAGLLSGCLEIVSLLFSHPMLCMHNLSRVQPHSHRLVLARWSINTACVQNLLYQAYIYTHTQRQIDISDPSFFPGCPPLQFPLPISSFLPYPLPAGDTGMAEADNFLSESC